MKGTSPAFLHLGDSAGRVRPYRQYPDNGAIGTATPPSSSSLWWNRYVELVQKNRHQLQLWESVLLDRLIWLFPGQSQGSIWRQVLWSWAELQHLAVDLALQQPYAQGDGSTLDASTLTTSSTSRAVFAARVALTVLHNLWPILHEGLQVAAPSPRSRQRQYHWELQLERLRLVLRLVIWLPHWWTMTQSTTVPPSIQPGILQRGGRWPSLVPSPSVEQQARRLAYRRYVGRWTGRNVLQPSFDSRGSTARTTTTGVITSTSVNRGRIALGELLYWLRPLFWAHCKYHHCHNGAPENGKLWKSWLASLGMDVVSLACLSRHQENEATAEEWRRRRLRLLLYLLRAPCHDTVTLPVAAKLENTLSYLPFLGNLLMAYLQDWLYYWKVYQLEE